jgi:hypothetical protein
LEEILALLLGRWVVLLFDRLPPYRVLTVGGVLLPVDL